MAVVGTGAGGSLLAALAAEQPELLQARWTMAISLGSHIILSCLGVALPTAIFFVHWRGLRHDDADALLLARRLGKAAAVLFAVGAVSGTVLSFEMGILWPGLFDTFGDVIGLPFALEGIFFFLEAIFLGIYLYGWKGLPSRVHLLTLVPIALSGVLGTLCIISVNAWMNNPSGFDIGHYLDTGEVIDVDPWAAMFNGNLALQFVHMLGAAYLVTGGLLASVYAVGWLRGRRDRLHRLGVGVGVAILCVAAPLQFLTGDLSARHVYEVQPAKFAASELLLETQRGAPFLIGGVLVDGEIVGGINIPDGLSLLLTFDPDGEVDGLDRIPADEQPPVNVVHLAFQLMAGIGTLLLAYAAFTGFVWWRHRRLPRTRWWWRATALLGPLAILALEAGWTVTEVGRQPWIVQGLMRVGDAVTTQAGVSLILVALVAIYVGMGLSLWFVLHRMSRRWREGREVSTPYGPSERSTGGDRGEPVPVPVAATGPAGEPAPGAAPDGDGT